MKLIGIAGTNGAGKDSVAELLATKYNFLFISVSDLLRDEAKRRGLSTERENLRTISTEWRRENGLGILVEKSIELYQQKGGDDQYNGLVVSSIRNPGEIDCVHDNGGQLVWVDADPNIRYHRIFSRKRDDDNKTYEQFLAEEQAETQHSGDEATLSLGDVRKKADITLLNEGSSLDQLEPIVLQRLGRLL